MIGSIQQLNQSELLQLKSLLEEERFQVFRKFLKLEEDQYKNSCTFFELGSEPAGRVDQWRGMAIQSRNIADSLLTAVTESLLSLKEENQDS